MHKITECAKSHEFIVMPDHVHGIVEFVGAGPRACPVNDHQPTNGQPPIGQPRRGVAPTMSVSDIVHRFSVIFLLRFLKVLLWIPVRFS
jgi:hypothetical protein